MIDKITKRSLADRAYESIKGSLLSGNFTEGSLIPSENQLSKSLSVSRVVVREALQRLREERIIVTYQGKGSFLANPGNFEEEFTCGTDIDYDTFNDVMEFRSCIECRAIQRAVEVTTDKELINILSAVDMMKNAKNDAEFNQADYDFHLKILKCSRNKAFLSAIQNESKNIMRCFSVMNVLKDSRAWAIELHTKIAACIINRDAKCAVDLLKNNGEYNLARMNELFKKI